jgi:hypothetical protein
MQLTAFMFDGHVNGTTEGLAIYHGDRQHRRVIAMQDFAPNEIVIPLYTTNITPGKRTAKPWKPGMMCVILGPIHETDDAQFVAFAFDQPHTFFCVEYTTEKGAVNLKVNEVEFNCASENDRGGGYIIPHLTNPKKIVAGQRLCFHRPSTLPNGVLLDLSAHTSPSNKKIRTA